MEQKILHVAVIDDFNECFVSYSDDELREQVSNWLLQNSVPPPTDAEWELILGEDRFDVDVATPALGWISYYKTESKLAA